MAFVLAADSINKSGSYHLNHLLSLSTWIVISQENGPNSGHSAEYFTGVMAAHLTDIGAHTMAAVMMHSGVEFPSRCGPFASRSGGITTQSLALILRCRFIAPTSQNREQHPPRFGNKWRRATAFHFFHF
jgi:hypothetical protein